MSFQAYLDTIKTRTGLGPAEFRVLAEQKGLLAADVKVGQIKDWLKADYDLGPGHAMALVATFRERPAADDRIEKQFAGKKAHWRASYDSLLASLREFGQVDEAPTDSYVSLVTSGRKFAIIAVTADRMDVGIKEKDAPVDDRFEAAGSWNSMVTHRVRVTDPAQLDAELLDRLHRAYDRA